MPLASSWKFYLLHEEVVAHSSAKLELTASLLAAAAPDGWQLIRSCVFFVGRGPCAVQAATGDRCVFIRCEQIHRNTSRVDDFDDAIKGSRKAPGNQSFAIRKDKKPCLVWPTERKGLHAVLFIVRRRSTPSVELKKTTFPPVSACFRLGLVTSRTPFPSSSCPYHPPPDPWSLLSRRGSCTSPCAAILSA